MLKKLTVVIAFAVFAPGAASAQDFSVVGTPCANAGNNTAFMLSWFACRGSFDGNTGEGGVIPYLNAQFGGTFTSLGKSDASGNGPFSNNPNTVNSGDLNFDSGLNGWYVLGLKSSKDMSFYLFQGNGQTSVKFNTNGTSLNKGVGRDLSHARLWSTQGKPSITSVVPEPSTYALMTTGLLGIFGFARRRRNNA